MSSENTARRIIWPQDSSILVRGVFLYVGQGSSVLILVRNGETYDTWVVDTNLDRKNGGIDVPKLVRDLVGNGTIRAFLNTHPHDDHLAGITELSEAVQIEQIFHSGHKPSKKYGSRYDELLGVIKNVIKAGGTETVLLGSNSAVTIGDAEYHVLAPAAYVTDDVNEDDADARKRRIHEQCAVVKFGKNTDWIIVTGDADRAAFEKHITKYHKDHLAAFALGASHHGSRTFFKEEEGDEPYLNALKAINPAYVLVSAPTQEESPHDHPHVDAMGLYENHVGKDNVHHTGKDRCSFLVDIFSGGGHSEIGTDDGDLALEYGLDEDDNGGASASNAAGPFQRPKQPTSDRSPRKYG